MEAIVGEDEESTATDDKEEIQDSLADLRAQMEAIVGEDDDADSGTSSDSSDSGASGAVLMGADYDSSKETLTEIAAQFDPVWEEEGYHLEEDYIFVIGKGDDIVDGEYLFQDGRNYRLFGELITQPLE